MSTKLSRTRILALVASSLLSSGTMLYAVDPPRPDSEMAGKAQPDAQADRARVDKMLGYKPRQKDVNYDLPDKAGLAKCTIEAAPQGGYIVRDGNGTVLRKFIDSDGNNTVDQFSYFKDGVEIYRETDTDNDKDHIPDQYRWLNTAGSRIGINKDQDANHTIDQWLQISAEEVTAEVVAALRDRDQARFKRLLLTPAELKTLGLGKAKTDQISKKLDTALANFNDLVGKKGVIAPDTRWVSFGGTQPATVPAGTEDSTADVLVYENVAAMIETAGKPQALTVGALVRVRDVWRLIDAPLPPDNNVAADVQPLFIVAERGAGAPNGSGPAQPNEEALALLAQIQKLDPNDHAKRADLLLKAAEVDAPERKSQWYRQAADSLSAAVQTQGVAAGVQKLRTLADKLKAGGSDEETAFYVELRFLMAEHGHKLAANGDFMKIQTEWIKDLEDYLALARKYPDSAEAMSELAISYEFSGDDTSAIKWYYNLARDYPNSPSARKAKGSTFRLDSVGKPFPLSGKPVNGPNPVDIKQLKGKVVLVQYWASWCEPCKADLPLLRDLRANNNNTFEVVGVCLDNSKADMQAFLKENKTPWPVLFEDGGLEGRFANELGVHTLPLMILVDQSGKVVNRNIRAAELGTELKKLIK